MWWALHWVFVAAGRLSLVVASGGYPLVAIHRLLIAVASLVAERGLVGVHGFSSCGAQALLPCSMWDLSGPRMEPMSPALAGRFLAPRPLEKSGLFLIAASI